MTDVSWAFFYLALIELVLLVGVTVAWGRERRRLTDLVVAKHTPSLEQLQRKAPRKPADPPTPVPIQRVD